MQTLLYYFFVSFILFSLSSKPAHAYISPDSASILFQLVVGGILAASVIIKKYWYKIKNAISALLPKKDDKRHPD